MMSDAICKALVCAESKTGEIVGGLHALHYYGERMSDYQRRAAITGAREAVEGLLVAILLAEKEIAPVASPVPSNVVRIGDHSPEHFGGDAA